MMEQMRRRGAALAWLVLLLAAGAAAQQTPIDYQLGFGKPNTHLLEISISATGVRGPAAEFAMPAWAPGWYVINNYAKMVQEFRAEGPGGRGLGWRKTDKQTWRVETGGAREVTVRYKLYGNTLAVDWVQYNDRHAHIAGPAAWMYLVGGKARPVRLTISTPAGWRVATGMMRAAENTFHAANYDQFIDAPLEISDYAEKTFVAEGTTYHVAVHDVMGKKDFSKFVEDTRKIVETAATMFAPVAGGEGRAAPFPEYWFLFHIWPGTGGGLEHLNSTQIFLGGDWASGGPSELPGPLYEDQLGVTSHEFFHAWNVKRLRPEPLGPFDYTREAYTPSLWICEGLTSYYGDLVLLRAGLLTPENYMENLAGLISFYESSPGRRERSLGETSWDTWFWYTGEGRIETNQANTDTSYYVGGQVLGHLLDFAIRQATGNRKSLDDWMRLMYSRHALPKPGFKPDDAVRAASEVAGRDLGDFFRRTVSAKEPLPYEEYFAYAGIRVVKEMETSRGWLGVGLSENPAGQARISRLVPGSPAEQAGLSRGDIVVALDGKEVGRDTLREAIGGKRPGDEVRVKVKRDDAVLELVVKLGLNPNPAYSLVPVENPSELQKKIFETWTTGRP